MQERKWITVLIPAVLLFGITSFASPAAAGSAKVDVCHFPPGNPDNFHTITISEKAFSAHLAHGDLGGACNALCATICDDENACTIDDTADCEEVGCPTSSTPVDCNDANGCTADSCEPVGGCVNTASVGESCDDAQICSGPDTCNAEGACQGAAIDDCCLGNEDCSQDPCDQASCNLATNRCGEAPIVCDPPDQCTVSHCAPDAGSCVDSAIVCPEAGETCNPNTGICEGDRCNQILCPVDQPCNPDTGDCEGDPCNEIVCPEAGETCNPDTGLCEGDPCNEIVCPEAGETCNPNTGLCEGDPCNCQSNVCTGDQSCNPRTGDCETDPCLIEDTRKCDTSPCPYRPIVCPEEGQTCNPDTGLCEAYPCRFFCPTLGQRCDPDTRRCANVLCRAD
jgi:hypothetical protein